MAKPAKKSKAKSVDKWKLKKKYEVIAPDIFNNVMIGPIFAKDEETLLGRTVETTMSKLVGSNQHHIKVMLTVDGTQGFNAKTSVKTVELSRAYISSQTGPGGNIVENVFRAKTKDEKDVVIKTVMFTRGKATTEQKKALRALSEEMVIEECAKSDCDKLIQEVVFGKMGSAIFGKARKVLPVGRVEVRKLEIAK